MSGNLKVGVIGGTGQLGSALATGWLESGILPQDNLWISNRSGRASAFENWPGVKCTSSNQQLADNCDVIILSVPPAHARAIDLTAPDKLVISVMAGVTHKQISDLTGTRKAVRAMSSPAARHRLAYSPWYSRSDLSADDRETVFILLSAVGTSDEVPEESHIETFTVLTGPVPGFAAFFADCMVQYALANNVAPETAKRAVNQLLTASSQIMSAEGQSPASYVQEMVDYEGTTAAGLVKLKELGVAQLIAQGLEASAERVRTIAKDT
ncbi:MAG: pyrroline-5-carboxylate reductase dimerization domain-containing protein [Pseudomonadota bacterium]